MNTYKIILYIVVLCVLYIMGYYDGKHGEEFRFIRSIYSKCSIYFGKHKRKRIY